MWFVFSGWRLQRGMLAGVAVPAQKLDADRGKATVMVEPYAPNVVRVTLSLIKDEALAGPGYGIVAKPMPDGWTVAKDGERMSLRSSRMVVTVSPPPHPGGPMPETSKFFFGVGAVCGHLDQDAGGADAPGYERMADGYPEP